MIKTILVTAAVAFGALASSLAARVGELGLTDRVRWLGALPQPKLVELYRRAAAMVVPSTDEGLGLVARDQ